MSQFVLPKVLFFVNVTLRQFANGTTHDFSVSNHDFFALVKERRLLLWKPEKKRGQGTNVPDETLAWLCSYSSSSVVMLYVLGNLLLCIALFLTAAGIEGTALVPRMYYY